MIIHILLSKNVLKYTEYYKQNIFIYKLLIVPTDKNEQHKIASFLMKINNSINLIEIQQDNVEIFKKGLLQQMFIFLSNDRQILKIKIETHI